MNFIRSVIQWVLIITVLAPIVILIIAADFIINGPPEKSRF